MPSKEVITISESESDDPNPPRRSKGTDSQWTASPETLARSTNEGPRFLPTMNSVGKAQGYARGMSEVRSTFTSLPPSWRNGTSTSKIHQPPGELENTGGRTKSNLSDWPIPSSSSQKIVNVSRTFPESIDLTREDSPPGTPITPQTNLSFQRAKASPHSNVQFGTGGSPSNSGGSPPASTTIKSPNRSSRSRLERLPYSLKTSPASSLPPQKASFLVAKSPPTGQTVASQAPNPMISAKDARITSQFRSALRFVKCGHCRKEERACDTNTPCTTCRIDGLPCVFKEAGSPDETDWSQSGIDEHTVRARTVPPPTDDNEYKYLFGDEIEEPSAIIRDLPRRQNEKTETFSAQETLPRTIADLLLDHLTDDADNGDIAQTPQADNAGRTSVPLEPDYYDRIVIDIKFRMEAFHEESVMAALRASRQRSKSQSVAKSGSHTNPFDRITNNKGSIERVSLFSKAPKASSQWEALRCPATVTKSSVLSLPKTKSIGRVGPPLLSRNATIGKYYPYSLDDEGISSDGLHQKYKEVEERYHDFSSNSATFSQQRTCAEFVDMYRPFVDGLLDQFQLAASDVVHFYMATDDELKTCADHLKMCLIDSLIIVRKAACNTCHIDCSSDLKYRELVKDEDTQSPDLETYLKAGALARSFHQTANISLWHVVSKGFSDLPLKRRKGSTEVEAEEEVEQICLICGLHNCSMHGAYEEKVTGVVEDADLVLHLNDPETDKNSRWCFATYADPVSEDHHVCSVWCGGPDTSLTSYKGIEEDGIVRGYADTRVFDIIPTPYFADNEKCSDSCFWLMRNRDQRVITTLEHQDEEVFLSNLRQCMVNQRGPCMMHDMLPHISCADLFRLMLLRGQKHPHPDQIEASPQKKQRAKRRAKTNDKIDLSRDYPVERRGVFFPCDHDGPCTTENNCKCAEAKVACERSCNCSKRCERLFQGCNCGLGPNVCADSKCSCWQAGRECDPVLCKGCGVETVLHQIYKYDEKMRVGRCRNNRIQLNLPARTIKAPSEVQGYGLFAGQDLKKGDFINEYRGEIISSGESDRRGAMYSLAGQEYLFNLNAEQEVDANNFGNKARFMNNSGKDSNINVFGQLMFCNGQHRIGLFARRDITAGEELLYNYDYPEALTKQFWERGEKSAKSKAATVRMPAAARSLHKADRKQRRKVRPILKSRGSSSQSPTGVAKGKRKRGGLQSNDSRTSSRDELDDFDPMEVDEAAVNMNDQADELDSDLSEFEDESQESSGSDGVVEEVPESDVEDEENSFRLPATRRKK